MFRDCASATLSETQGRTREDAGEVGSLTESAQEIREIGAGQLSRPSLTECDGRELKQLLGAGSRWLEQHVALINELNVYPVPDGDTGTNMLLTMQAVMREIDGLGSDESVSAVAHAAAHGALMGARGNSGVILSQIFRGFARSLDDKEAFDAADFVVAAQEASDTAYKGVVKPVEGTILTVAREAAAAAALAAADNVDLYTMFERTLEAANAAVEFTPDLLPVLKEAGVVDAGGKGLAVIMEGGLRFLRGESVGAGAAMEEAVELHAAADSHAWGELEYGYDVQFILKGEDLDVTSIRANIDAMGESTLVVGDSHLVKVHVHVQNPGEPLSYGVSLGTLSDVIVENMDEQYQDFATGQARPPVAMEEITDIATVAVVSGPGLIRIFESLGVSAIVHGGQTMNPSTEEILAAVESLNARSAILLPNNPNIILAAKQAQELATKQVYVVPTRTIPQGVGALLAFNLQIDAETNARLMEGVLEDIQTIEVTRAIRSTTLNGLQVQEGDIIGLLNDDLVACGSDAVEVVLQTTESLEMDDYEIVTIYYGEGVGEEEANTLAEVIEEKYPFVEIEIKDGGQMHYDYIISVE
jgi:DAK2 domain fusion protein YloV